MPLVRRIPKRGFTNELRKEMAVVNVKNLNRFEEGEVVTPERLKEVGLVKKINHGVKVLGDGELVKRLTVKAHRFSEAARQKIEAAGGQVEVI
jgi:large subunit ribosomal protein L15